jgi:3-methyladenine DNA glycosylase/8-oxoguanine DNA glycosylase
VHYRPIVVGDVRTVAERVESTWRPGRPVDVLATLGPLCHGGGDPAHQVGADGTFWWAATTPDGPGTLALRAGRDGVRATAWGRGAEWLVDGVPTLLGAGDDWSRFDCAMHPVLDRTLRSYPGMRLARTRLVFDALLPAVVEQRVTGHEARRAWRGLLRRHGTPAPGPLAGLRVPPSPAAVLDVPTWTWHRLGVDLARQRTARAAATVAPRLEECVAMTPEAAVARLRVVPGVGEWTAAETVQRALGDPDTVSVGDYHIHDLVVHALTGRARGDDAEMLRLLEPWRGQRQRIVRLVELSGVDKPRFGPRYAPHDMRAM